MMARRSPTGVSALPTTKKINKPEPAIPLRMPWMLKKSQILHRAQTRQDQASLASLLARPWPYLTLFWTPTRLLHPSRPLHPLKTSLYLPRSSPPKYHCTAKWRQRGSQSHLGRPQSVHPVRHVVVPRRRYRRPFRPMRGTGLTQGGRFHRNSLNLGNRQLVAAYLYRTRRRRRKAQLGKQ